MTDQVVAMIRQAGAARIDRVAIANACGVDIKRVNTLIYTMRRRGDIPPPPKRILIADGHSGRLEFKSLYHAEEEGFELSSIKRCLAGTRKTHAGYTWRYEAPE